MSLFDAMQRVIAGQMWVGGWVDSPALAKIKADRAGAFLKLVHRRMSEIVQQCYPSQIDSQSPAPISEFNATVLRRLDRCR